MSVTFEPVAGTCRMPTFYDVDGADEQHCNGIVRFEHSEPSVNMANGNAAYFMQLMDFGSRIDEGYGPEPVLWGYIPAHRCRELLSNLEDMTFKPWNVPSVGHVTDDNREFLERYATRWIQVLRCAIYNNCDIAYG